MFRSLVNGHSPGQGLLICHVSKLLITSDIYRALAECRTRLSPHVKYFI